MERPEALAEQDRSKIANTMVKGKARRQTDRPVSEGAKKGLLGLIGPEGLARQVELS